MFSQIAHLFNQLTYQPIFQALVFLYQLLGENLGFAIIGLTLGIRLILVPITLPALRSTTKIRDLKPKLDEIKKKFKDDKKRLQQEQLKLYQENNINPAAGCLPYIVQFIILIALYRVFIDLLQNGSLNGSSINLNFLWLNLAEPDKSYIMPIIAGISQLILALMIIPATSTAAEKTLAAATPTKKDDKKAEDMTDMAQTMQQQMIFVMPAITFFIALRFPAGLALYWVITTMFSIVQQYFVSGLGGLQTYLKKVIPLK